MGRILGIDYGMKRTGISTTDPLQIIVNPLDVVLTEDLYTFLESYLISENVDKIVIGEPKQSDGSPVYFENNIEKLISKLNKSFPSVKIDRQDESYTSSEAKDLLVKMGLNKKKRQDKSMLDRISAVLILQRYLNHI